MSTAENESAWSTTAANNASSDANINWAEGQDPASVNNSARSMMAARAKARLDQSGGLTAGGSANALTVTTNQVLISGQLTAGLFLKIKAASTNTSATVTFAPDGLTAQNIKRADGTALAIGSIQAGQFLDLVYNSGTTEWWAANIPGLLSQAAGSSGLLTSGTFSTAANQDISLTSYQQYNGIRVVLYDVNFSSVGANITIRLSTDGVSYDASAGNYLYAYFEMTSGGATANSGSNSATQMVTSASNDGLTASRVDLDVTIMGHSSSSFWPSLMWSVFLANTGGSDSARFSGGGARKNAQVTKGIRFIANGTTMTGSYAVYGL